MATNIRSLDSALQTTIEWLKDIQSELHLDDQEAYLATKAVLHALRDRMSVEESAHFSAQLPLLMKGMFYEGWDPTGKPDKIRTKGDFLAVIKSKMPTPDADPERYAGGVFKVLEKRLSRGEIQDVKSTLPENIREMWPEAAADISS
jgi:uncharacterized protein (DUF2267 family)